MGRKLDLSSLTEEEAEHVLHVVQRDMQLRKTEEERLSELKQELDEEDSRCNLLSRQNGFNERCCIRCCSPFTFLLKPRRRCLHCRYYVCKRCCCYSATDKGWLCSACQKSRLLKTQSLEWFYANVRRRFRRFGSAKVLKTLYRRHIAEQGNLDELTEESTYEESIGNEGSVYESDSTFYRHSQEHSMADTMNVAVRVAEEAIDEAIAKAERQTTNQEKLNEARYLRDNRKELVQELTNTIVQNIIRRKKDLPDMKSDFNPDPNSDVSCTASPIHRSQSALASQPSLTPSIWRSRSAFSLLTNDIQDQRCKADERPVLSNDCTQGLKKDGVPAPNLPSWKSVDRLDNSSVSSVLQSPDGNWIALQSNQLSRPSLLTKRKSLVFCALEKESNVVSAYDGMGSDTEPDADGAWGAALLEIRHKMSSNNLLNDTQPASPQPAPASPPLLPADQPQIDSGKESPATKFHKRFFPFLKRKVPLELRRSSSQRLSVMDINFNPEGTESSEDGLEDSRVKRTRRRRRSKREEEEEDDSQSLSSSEPDYTRMLLDVVVKHRNTRQSTSEVPSDLNVDADTLSSEPVTPDAFLPGVEEPKTNHYGLTSSLEHQLTSKKQKQTSQKSETQLSLIKGDPDTLEECIEEKSQNKKERSEFDREDILWDMEVDGQQEGTKQMENCDKQQVSKKCADVETNGADLWKQTNLTEEKQNCPDTMKAEPTVEDHRAKKSVDKELENSRSTRTDMIDNLVNDIIQESAKKQSDNCMDHGITTAEQLMKHGNSVLYSSDKQDLKSQIKTCEDTAGWWDNRIDVEEEKREEAAESISAGRQQHSTGPKQVKEQNSSEEETHQYPEGQNLSNIERQRVKAGERTEQSQHVKKQDKREQTIATKSGEHNASSTEGGRAADLHLIHLVSEKEKDEYEVLTDSVVKALDNTIEEIEEYSETCRCDVRQQEEGTGREEMKEKKMTMEQHVEMKEDIEVNPDKERTSKAAQETLTSKECACNLTDEEVVQSCEEESEKFEDHMYKDSLDSEFCGQEEILSAEEIYKDVHSLDLEKGLQFVSTLLQQKYSAASLRSITTEVLKVLNATEDLVQGAMSEDQAQLRDLPVLPPAQSKGLDEQLCRLEENVYVAASAVFGLEAELGDLEECARSISASTTDGELAHLEEQVASAAAQVQQSELQVSDIAARIAALKNAGLNVAPQTRFGKLQTLDSSRQRRRRLPAPPKQDKKT